MVIFLFKGRPLLRKEGLSAPFFPRTISIPGRHFVRKASSRDLSPLFPGRGLFFPPTVSGGWIPSHFSMTSSFMAHSGEESSQRSQVDYLIPPPPRHDGWSPSRYPPGSKGLFIFFHEALIPPALLFT